MNCPFVQTLCTVHAVALAAENVPDAQAEQASTLVASAEAPAVIFPLAQSPQTPLDLSQVPLA